MYNFGFECDNAVHPIPMDNTAQMLSALKDGDLWLSRHLSATDLLPLSYESVNEI